MENDGIYVAPSPLETVNQPPPITLTSTSSALTSTPSPLPERCRDHVWGGMSEGAEWLKIRNNHGSTQSTHDRRLGISR